MTTYSPFESLLLAILIIAMLFWVGDAIKNTEQQQSVIQSKWSSLIVLVGLVIMWGIFLLAMV
jgi:hypothetical protein